MRETEKKIRDMRKREIRVKGERNSQKRREMRKREIRVKGERNREENKRNEKDRHGSLK